MKEGLSIDLLAKLTGLSVDEVQNRIIELGL
jgi:hypothetical protein